MNNIIFLCFLIIGLIYCDGNGWIKQDETVTVLEDQGPILDTSTTEEAKEEITTNNEITNITSNMDSTDLSDTTQMTPMDNSTETEDPPKLSGCATRLLTGKNFCWASCNSGSTSNFWNTWCFTTNATSQTETPDYVECGSDQMCKPEWKCMSSCGMFSPHWDRDGIKLEEPNPSSNSN